MSSVSEAVRKDIANLPETARSSALAAQALLIAERLDSRVGARDLADLSRELRLVLADLKAQPDAGREDAAAAILAELGKPL